MIVNETTPAAIDAVWFDLSSKINALDQRAEFYRKYARDEKLSEASRAGYAAQAEEVAAKNAPARAALVAQTEPLQAEWDRRGGWKRYVYCVANNGHYHRGTECHTLRPFRTQVVWVAELSGLNDEQVIEQVGFKACSQPECFPLAPVHPAWARTEAEAKSNKNAEREAKYLKGLAVREKKVANIEKRFAKMRALLAEVEAGRFRSDENEERFQRVHAEYGIRDGERELGWAKREVERWLAKKK
jgi:hypothetical protein